MNVNQLLTMIDSVYPSAVSATDKVAFMNMAQDELSKNFGIVVVDSSLKTAVGQDEYTYPTGLKDLSQIQLLEIGNTTTPTRYDYMRYYVDYASSSPPVGYRFFQITSSTGAKSLGISPIPDVVDLPIRITYRKKLTNLDPSTLAQVPDFDERCHDLLVYYACHMICSIGASPDGIQADVFMQKYQSSLSGLWRLRVEENRKNPTVPRDNSAWRRRRNG